MYSPAPRTLVIQEGILQYFFNDGLLLFSAKVIFNPVENYATFLMSDVEFHVGAEQMFGIAKSVVAEIQSRIAEHGGKLIVCANGKNAEIFSQVLKEEKSQPTFMCVSQKALKAKAVVNLESNILVFDPRNVGKVQQLIFNQSLALLKTAWWAAEKTEEDFKRSVETATRVYVMLQEDNVVGFVRYLSTGTLGYILYIGFYCQRRMSRAGYCDTHDAKNDRRC